MDGNSTFNYSPKFPAANGANSGATQHRQEPIQPELDLGQPAWMSETAYYELSMMKQLNLVEQIGLAVSSRRIVSASCEGDVLTIKLSDAKPFPDKLPSPKDAAQVVVHGEQTNLAKAIEEALIDYTVYLVSTMEVALSV